MSDVSAANKCASCQSESLEEDEGMIVCTSCGTVAEDRGGVRHDDTQNTGLSNPDVAFLSCNKLSSRLKHALIKRSTAQSNLIPTEARKVCFSTVDKLAERLCFTRDMKLELKKHVKDSLVVEYKNSWRQKKITIAAICAYITMIRNGRSVSVSDVCSISGCNKQEFASLYYKYLSQFPQNHPGLQRLDELIPSSLKGFSFRENEKFKIFKLTQELLELLGEVMLIESKCPRSLIAAASFIAWKSLDRSRSSISFSKFKIMTGADASLNRGRNVKELENKLITLSSSIPWIAHIKISRSTISHYVPDILEFKRTVVYDHKSHPQPDAASSSPAAAPDVEDVDGDREISDSEIDMYIRSSAEVSAVKRLRAACEADDV